MAQQQHWQDRWQDVWQQGPQDWFQEVQQWPAADWPALAAFGRPHWPQPAEVVLAVLRITAHAWQCAELRPVSPRSLS